VTGKLIIDTLQTGDLIFSTTNDPVSNAIKASTKSRYSHASIYFRRGVVIESNDDGVLPRKIDAVGVNSSGLILGLPYANWTNISVLRHPHYEAEEWSFAIERALRAHIGLDYPPPSEVIRGGPFLARILLYPIAKLYEAIQWLRNRETLAHDAWCSKLIGYVLAGHLGHRMSARQQGVLNRSNPQQLFDIAIELGYVVVTNPTDQINHEQHSHYEAARTEFLQDQDATYIKWQELAEKRRASVREELGFRALRDLSKTAKIGLALVLVGVAVTAGYQIETRLALKPKLTVTYARLFGVFQVPAIMTGVLSDNGVSTKNKIFINDYTVTRAAWEKSPLGKARFALGPVGDQISGRYREYASKPTDLSNKLYVLGAIHSGLNIQDYRYLETWTFQQSKAERDAVELDATLRGVNVSTGRQEVEAEIERRFVKSFERVGYLFLTLELQPGTKPPDSIEIEYVLANANSEFGRLSKTEDQIIPLNAVFSEVRKLKVAPPLDGSPVLLPLAVFVSDQDGLPQRFASSVLLPSRLLINHEGSTTQMPIPKPSLTQGARLILPIGWYHQ
jgi:hypothetical protein